MILKVSFAADCNVPFCVTTEIDLVEGGELLVYDGNIR